MSIKKHYTVVIVGAGAAGIGMGIVLKTLGLESYAILERGEAGESFRRWPKGINLITPSFPGNDFGLLDLNAIALNTSPALLLGKEHPSGIEYARYLEHCAEQYDLPVMKNIDVTDVRKEGELFLLQTGKDTFTCNFLVWAAGEFQYPDLRVFEGAELCRHYSLVEDWSKLEGDELVIIGGYESGIDAAVKLCEIGKRSAVYSKKASWLPESPDPSISLSPYTLERLGKAYPTGRIKLTDGVSITKVQKSGGLYYLFDGEDFVVSTPYAPVLATGFKGSITRLEPFFMRDEKKRLLLTVQDESTVTPGLFLTGSQVRHEDRLFCFIYKFRQRFPVVAQAIAERLGMNTAPLEIYRQMGMFYDLNENPNSGCAC